MKILGVDPGVFGAIAYYDGQELLLWDMPIYAKASGGNDLDIHKLHKIIVEAGPEHCFLEKTTALPKISGKAAYSMGKSEGAFVALFVALGLPYTLVRLAEWEKYMACPADKGLSRQRASQLLPQFSANWDLKKHVDRAEASMIAMFGYQQQGYCLVGQ